MNNPIKNGFLTFVQGLFMLLDKHAVAKIAKLARIEVSDTDKEFFSKELSGILQWMEQLNEVNTQGVPQMASVSAVKLPWREDKVTDGNQQEAVVQNATQHDYGCFVVPKVIE
jgi:aspartyl-tRNA(Asn)/glutamyl-tRNA(Gln) amidotransferase subunit C